jgi:CRISPR system Cascade subunit CasD
MATLLLRLQGPMQSWGTQSRFLIRDTGLEPSKSGVIGLICAALGKPRHEEAGQPWPTLEELAKLRMAVRVDRAGMVRRDYHTAGGSRSSGQGYGVAKANGTSPETVLSQRYYLADAAFLVGLEGDNRPLLERLHQALKMPVWPLALGRKSFVPGNSVYLKNGLLEVPLEVAMATYPLLVAEEPHGGPVERRMVVDASPQVASEVRADVPLNFATRQFTIRHVAVDTVTIRTGEGQVCI